MIKSITVLTACAILSLQGLAQEKKTTLSAQIYDYPRDMVYFDCTQSPFLCSEYHTNPGEEHLYSFQADQITSFVINGRTTVLLLPGDSLHLNIRYDGKNVQSVEYSGTKQAVDNNKLFRSIDQTKRAMRYKSQLLACAVVDVKPKERIDSSRVLLTKVDALIAARKGISPQAATYLKARTEAEAYTSYMEYPMMYAEIRHTPIEKQDIGDYWKLMDGTRLRSDKVSLRCSEYVSMLMRYVFYAEELKAKKEGKTYKRPGTLEEMYKDYAAFYKGEQRDAVLYTLLCNFIRNGKEIQRVDPLLKEYREKYNQDKEYTKILDSLLQ